VGGEACVALAGSSVTRNAGGGAAPPGEVRSAGERAEWCEIPFMGKLDGKTAIVTGGSGGIGAATGRRFVAEGANVLLVDLDGEALDRVAREIGGDRVATQVADVSDPAAAGGYVAAAVERFGRLDVVFANAGIEGTVCPLVEYPEEDF